MRALAEGARSQVSGRWGKVTLSRQAGQGRRALRGTSAWGLLPAPKLLPTPDKKVDAPSRGLDLAALSQHFLKVPGRSSGPLPALIFLDSGSSFLFVSPDLHTQSPAEDGSLCLVGRQTGVSSAGLALMSVFPGRSLLLPDVEK